MSDLSGPGLRGDQSLRGRGRHVYMFDGTTTLMPDTTPNQQAFSQTWNQKRGAGLPLARIGAIFSLSCGVILYLKIEPELVRKEIWTHALAYNLIRTIMAQAASRHTLNPRSISFKGAIQTLEAFQPIIALRGQQNSATRRMFYEQLLAAVAAHRVADRPDRIEPRQIKRRHKHYVPLSVPRADAKLRILKGLSKN